MVKKQDNMDAVYYVCQKCGLTYKDEEWAEKCETWCSEHEGT